MHGFNLWDACSQVIRGNFVKYTSWLSRTGEEDGGRDNNKGDKE
jgi:hypothetical protein